MTTTHRVVIEDEQPAVGRGRRLAALIAGSAVAVLVVGSRARAYGRGRQTSKHHRPVKASPAPPPQAATRRGLVIKVPGDSVAAQEDVARFVRASLAGTDRTKPLTIDVRFVAGDSNYTPAGCLAAPVTVEANANDIKALHDNDTASNRAVVADQRSQAVDTIATAAADAVAAIPRPTKPASGLLTVLQVAADVAQTSNDVFVLTSTDTSADDCLHATARSDPDPTGGTIADEAVQRCVEAHALQLIGGDIHLDLPRSVRLTGAQQAAADAMFAAVCTHATVHAHCSS